MALSQRIRQRATDRYRLRASVRRLNRARWVTKARNAQVGEVIRYVLWSPEVGDYSWTLANVDEAARSLADAFDTPVDRVRALLEEPAEDRQLADDYAARRHRLLLPSRMAIGQRALWWAMVRLQRPRLTIETGVWYGLGALVLLRAIERNAEDGFDGARLVSFDPDPTAGWLVPDRLRDRWTLIRAFTDDALEPILSAQRPDLFIHDTPSGDGATERHELHMALTYANPGAAIVSGNGMNTTALSDLCRQHGLAFHHAPLVPVDHWSHNNGMSLTFATAPRSRADDLLERLEVDAATGRAVRITRRREEPIDQPGGTGSQA